MEESKSSLCCFFMQSVDLYIQYKLHWAPAVPPVCWSVVRCDVGDLSVTPGYNHTLHMHYTLHGCGVQCTMVTTREWPVVAAAKRIIRPETEQRLFRSRSDSPSAAVSVTVTASPRPPAPTCDAEADVVTDRERDTWQSRTLSRCWAPPPPSSPSAWSSPPGQTTTFWQVRASSSLKRWYAEKFIICVYPLRIVIISDN